MRLLIISNMAHWQEGGRVVGWGPPAQEIDHLARLFDEIVHVGCLHEPPAPSAALPYQAENVRLCAVPPAGGAHLIDKVRILRLLPHYARVILKEVRLADAVHLRCPANITLLAIILLSLLRHPKKRWVKYAGNWQSYKGEPWSYRLQRWWLKRGLTRAEVTVNGQWPDQPVHVHAFLNPCLTEEELSAGEKVAARKYLAEPVRLLYVGRLERAKGVERSLRILARLRRQGFSATLALVGDGPERRDLEAFAAMAGVEQEVTFFGWIPRTELAAFYEEAHFFLMPTTCSEGWPKVLSEGMAYGVVPLASTVSSIPQYLSAFGTGRALAPEDTGAFADAVAWYLAHARVWKEESQKGVAAARRFSYTQYSQAVQRLFALPEMDGRSAPRSQEPLWAGAVIQQR